MINEIISILIFFLGVICITIILFRITKYKYTIKNGLLVMTWYYLGLLPIDYSVKFERIAAVYKIDRKEIPRILLTQLFRVMIWGKFNSEVVMLKLKNGIVCNIIISPTDIESFLYNLEERIVHTEAGRRN